MGEEGGVLALDGDVVLQGDVADLDVIESPETSKCAGGARYVLRWVGLVVSVGEKQTPCSGDKRENAKRRRA